jgi:hypothetical protein
MHRWEDNIKLNTKELRWEIMDWIYLAQDRTEWWAHVNMVINYWMHKRTGTSEVTRRVLTSSQEGLRSIKLVSRTQASLTLK